MQYQEPVTCIEDIDIHKPEIDLITPHIMAVCSAHKHFICEQLKVVGNSRIEKDVAVRCLNEIGQTAWFACLDPVKTGEYHGVHMLPPVVPRPPKESKKA
jgi:hypothetical protein